jgi:hypothetical protein
MLPPIVPRLLTAGSPIIAGCLSERRRRLLHIGGCRDVSVRRQRADPDRVAAARDAAQLRNAADVDNRRRSREAQLHERNQAVAAGQELGARVGRKKAMHVGQRTGAVIVEVRGIHD